MWVKIDVDSVETLFWEEVRKEMEGRGFSVELTEVEAAELMDLEAKSRLYQERLRKIFYKGIELYEQRERVA